jgi:CheY-like chemotaxis protein
VDDLQVNLDLVHSIFASSGYRVITTSSPEHAVKLARELAPDLLLSDVCMPEGSGYDLIRTTDPALKAIPFVFITSTVTNEQDEIKTCLEEAQGGGR